MEKAYTLEDARQELAREAHYIGEDGEMVAVADTAEEAARMMEQRMREDLGDVAETVEADDLGTLFLHLTTPEQKMQMDEAEWYVDRKESTVSVWYMPT